MARPPSSRPPPRRRARLPHARRCDRGSRRRRPRRPTWRVVAFVGTGPGDPGLLTVRAVELLARADVVITEAAEHAALLARCSAPDAEVVATAVRRGRPAADPRRRAPRSSPSAPRAAARRAAARRRPGLYATRRRGGRGLRQGGRARSSSCPASRSVTAVPAYAGVPLTTRSAREVARRRRRSDGEGRLGAARRRPARSCCSSRGDRRIGEVAAALIEAGRDPADPGRVTAGRHHDRAAHRRRRRSPTSSPTRAAAGIDRAGRHRRRRRRRDARGGCPGSRPSRCSAGGSWCRAPRSRPARCPRSCAATAPCPRRCRRSPSSRRAPRSRWTGRSTGLVDGPLRVGRVHLASTRCKAVREKFDEYGLDARAFAGIKVAAVGEETAERLARVRRQAGPGARRRAVRRAACSRTGRRTTTCSTRSTGCSCRAPTSRPRRSSPGCIELGWEVDDVTAYRTVRAAPPPAPIREAIKGGGFDAVLFTSSSTVRNLVGIAGKPHASTVIACIGPATAKTARSTACGSTCWRRTPSVEALADALADYGALVAAVADRGRRAGDEAVRAATVGAPQGDLMTGFAGRCGRGGCAAPRRCGGWSRRRRLQPAPTWCCRCSSRRARPSRRRSRRMPGVVQHTRDSLRKAAAEAVEAGVGGLMLFGVPPAQGRRRQRARRPRRHPQRRDRATCVAEVGDAPS